MATSGAKPLGCYKCGKTGHWSRDCPAPPSEWVNNRQQQGTTQYKPPQASKGATPSQKGQTGEKNPPDNNAQDEAAATAAALAAAAASKKRKRPKVTLELLKEARGIPDVYSTFPEAFKRQFKGRGHEASNLRRLLEMYKRWQERIFPSSNFDDFIMRLERLSGTAKLRFEMREMRMSILKVAQDALAPPPAQEQPEGVAGPMMELDGTAGAAQPGVAVEDEDELMLELGDEDLLGYIGEAPQQQQQQPEEEVDPDDLFLELAEEEFGEEPNPDELEMAECLRGPSPGHAGAPGGRAQQQQPGGRAGMEGPSQEESLMLELADDEEELDYPHAADAAAAGAVPQQQQPPQPEYISGAAAAAGGLAPRARGGQLEMDDDQLLELAAAGLSQPAGSTGPLAGEAQPLPKELDDDELLELAAAGLSQPAGATAPSTGQHERPGVEMDDDELLELAAAGLSQPAGATAPSAGQPGHPLVGMQEPAGEPGVAQPLMQAQRDTNAGPEEIVQPVPSAALGTEASAYHQVDLHGTEHFVSRAYALVAGMRDSEPQTQLDSQQETDGEYR